MVLCDLEDIPDGGTREFSAEETGQPAGIFIIRQQGELYAYQNSCPHTGLSLNWQPNQFLDMDRKYIQCSNHNALFLIENGLCIAGSCTGQSLTAQAIQVAAGRIKLMSGQPAAAKQGKP